MKVMIEDYNGNDICSFECIVIEGIGNFENCNIADIDKDEYEIKQIRIQLEEEE